MLNKKYIVGLDIDDTCFPFNSIACEMANEKYGINPPLTIEDITSWENAGRANIIHEFYCDAALYERQEASITKKMIEDVLAIEKIAKVYFITACGTEFMSQRARMLLKVFGEYGFESDRIIMGSAKELVKFDFMVDDNLDNILKSKADFPILMRRPWNQKMTGLLSVNNLKEAGTLIQHIVSTETEKEHNIPRVIALVGPSGSNKNKIAKELTSKCGEMFKIPTSYSTKSEGPEKRYVFMSPEEFNKCTFFEHTSYAGYKYGTKYEDIKAVLDEGKNPVLVLDICGAIGMKSFFPTSIVFCDRQKEGIIRSIVSAENMNDEEKTLRLLSVDAERKNKVICDYTVNGEDIDGSVAEIIGTEYIKEI